MDGRLRKTERLIKMWLLLINNPFRFTTADLSNRFDIDVRTVYRDMDTLDVELRVPIRKQGVTWGIDEGHYLPPIRFTIPEAMTIFLAARLMVSFSHRYDPYTDSAFAKLSSAVPNALREPIQKTLDWMQKLPREDRIIRVIASLADGWVRRRQVKIMYRAIDVEQPSARIVEPYFIEPAALGHASYLIGYCHRNNSVRTFKIDRIQSVELLEEGYSIPLGFDANKYLGASWGIAVGGEVARVKLRFARDLARLMEETVWHPSQRLRKNRDGTVDVTFEVFDTPELRNWVFGWGDRVEVLKPESLRQSVISTAAGLQRLYAPRTSVQE